MSFPPLRSMETQSPTRGPEQPLHQALSRMETTTLGPRAMAELLTREAGPCLEDQHLGTPADDRQIKSLKQSYKRQNMTRNMISLEYDIMRFSPTAPRVRGKRNGKERK